MKDELCHILCEGIFVKEVPVGLAVSTAFSREDGDAIGFYVVNHPSDSSIARLEDDGQLLPLLELAGVDLSGGNRAEALDELLRQCRAKVDFDENLILTDYMPKRLIPSAVVQFLELLIRFQDFALLTRERVESTFREDVRVKIAEIMPDVDVAERRPITPELPEFEADFVLIREEHAPLGIFLGTSDERVYEAVVAKMAAEHEAKVSCSIVAMLEFDNSVTRKVRQKALNRLDAMPIFRGEENQAVIRVRSELTKRRSERILQ
jgi:hypothetical protein